jgi:hypothetical protein
MHEVISRIARAFFDDTLPKNHVYAVTIEHSSNDSVKDCYINLHFFRQIGSYVKPALQKLSSIGSGKDWKVSVVLKNAESSFVIFKSSGLSDEDKEVVLKIVTEEVSPHVQGRKGRGRPKTRERDEEGKVVRSKLPKKEARTPKTKAPRSLVVRQPEVEISPHIEEIDGPQERQPDNHWRSASTAEMYLRQVYARPVSAFNKNTWGLVYKSYKDHLPDEFKRKYADQLAAGREYLIQTFGPKFIQASDIIEAFAASSFKV